MTIFVPLPTPKIGEICLDERDVDIELAKQKLKEELLDSEEMENIKLKIFKNGWEEGGKNWREELLGKLDKMKPYEEEDAFQVELREVVKIIKEL